METVRPRKLALRRYALYRRAIRSADAYLEIQISRMLPQQDDIPVPGVMTVLGCCLRQLMPARWRRRPPDDIAPCVPVLVERHRR